LTRVCRGLVRAFSSLAVLAGLVACSVSVAPPPAQASVIAPADGYGFAQGAAWVTGSPADTNRELDAVARTGASWVRVPMDWSQIEPSRGQFNWGVVDNLVNSARGRNLRILALIGYTPVWARVEGAQLLFPTSPPQRPADFAAFVTAAVKRYGDRVSAWEIWNEPNLPLFFGFVDNKGARYADILKAVYPAIKAVQPNSTVVAAGLSRLPGSDAPPSFLQQLYDAGAGGFFDAAAAHPYVFPTGFAADPENGWSDVARMHDVMAAHGDGGKKIWMTELGAPTGNSPDSVTPEEQAKQITDVLAAAAGLGYSGPAFIYSVRDLDSADTGNRESNFGALLTSDWQPKLAADVLAK
jgi:polysaccharide biosynthesis protein PslG